MNIAKSSLKRRKNKRDGAWRKKFKETLTLKPVKGGKGKLRRRFTLSNTTMALIKFRRIKKAAQRGDSDNGGELE